MQKLKAVGAFLLFLIVALAVGGLLDLAVTSSGLYHPGEGWNAPDFIVSDGIGFVVALAATALFARFERRRLGEYGLPLRRSALPQILEGFAWGAAAVTLGLGLLVASGGASLHGAALSGPALARSALLWLAAMIVLGFFEEYTFRGYALDALARGFGFPAAAAVNAILFGALHYFTKPMENVTDATTVALLTLFMCMTIARTRALWFACGFHTAFDYCALIVFGSPNTGNSGKAVADRLLDVQYSGPAWLTGGPRGLEASAPMFVVIAALFAAYAYRTRSASRNAAIALNES